jgi:hypothetical protein
MIWVLVSSARLTASLAILFDSWTRRFTSWMDEAISSVAAATDRYAFFTDDKLESLIFATIRLGHTRGSR